jgi:hypothetical protein
MRNSSIVAAMMALPVCASAQTLPAAPGPMLDLCAQVPVAQVEAALGSKAATPPASAAWVPDKDHPYAMFACRFQAEEGPRQVEVDLLKFGANAAASAEFARTRPSGSTSDAGTQVLGDESYFMAISDGGAMIARRGDQVISASLRGANAPEADLKAKLGAVARDVLAELPH